MSFRKMKIKINSPEHCEAVQKRLFELGYKWYGSTSHDVRDYYPGSNVLWGEPCGSILHSSLQYADDPEYAEYPWVDILAEQQQEAQEPVKPPTGLMPRSVFEATTRQQRAKDILAAMQRYAEAGEAVPVEWIDELKELVC